MTDAVTELIADCEPVTVMVAAQLGGKYSAWITAEDVAQEIRLWLFTEAEMVAELLAVGDDPEANSAAAKLLFRRMRRAASQVCREAKAQQSGYAVADEYVYTAATVAELLPVVLSGGVNGYEAAGSDDVNDGAVASMGDPAEGGDYAAAIADVAAAWAKHPDPLLHVLYASNEPDREAIAASWGVALSTVYRRENVALSRLVDALGGGY